METPLLKTKLYIPPPRHDLVPRPRLIERLNAGLHRKLTLISAPAGFGKTTLLSEWVNKILVIGDRRLDSGETSPSPIPNTQSPKVAWVSLDEGDNDPTRFWAYVIAALQTIRAYKEAGNTVLTALDSPQPPPIEALLTGLINEISASPDPFILVLDDFYTITAPQINDAVAFLLNNLPPPMHLVISSRADPPWHLARMRVRRRNDAHLFATFFLFAALNNLLQMGLYLLF